MTLMTRTTVPPEQEKPVLLPTYPQHLRETLTPRERRAMLAGQQYYISHFTGTTATQSQLGAAMEKKKRQWQHNHVSEEWQLHFTRGWNAAILADPRASQERQASTQKEATGAGPQSGDGYPIHRDPRVRVEAGVPADPMFDKADMPVIAHSLFGKDDEQEQDRPLSASAQLHQFINQIPTSREVDQHLVARARAGDEQARHALIEQTLPYIRKVATSFAHRLAHDELLDLISEAALAVTEKVDQALAVADDPLYYLFSVAKGRICNYCCKFRSLISNHSSKRFSDPIYSIDSIDAPLYDDGKITLAETLAQPLEEPSDGRDYSDLYCAVEELPSVQKEV